MRAGIATGLFALRFIVPAVTFVVVVVVVVVASCSSWLMKTLENERLFLLC